MPDIYEWRGVKGLVAAEVLTDDSTNGYTTGAVFPIAGVAEVTRNIEQSMDTHYYDNYGAVVIDSLPQDSLSITASAIPEDVYAKLTGAYYDTATGMLVVGKYSVKYFAVGYIAEDTNGNERYIWHLKGRFAIGGVSHTTKNNSTDASGQTLTYNAVRTATEFTKGASGANSIQVNAGLGKADLSNFFDTVQTPDTIIPLVSYTLTKTVGVSTSITVKNIVTDTYIDSGDPIYEGDMLKISFTTTANCTVNGTAFINGDIHVVSGNVTVVTTLPNDNQ